MQVSLRRLYSKVESVLDSQKPQPYPFEARPQPHASRVAVVVSNRYMHVTSPSSVIIDYAILILALSSAADSLLFFPRRTFRTSKAVTIPAS